MLFVCFYLFLVVSTIVRVLPVKTGERQPFLLCGHTTWSISPGLSPTLVFRPIHFAHSFRSSVCRQKITPRNRPQSVLILLLSGDISANPGPTSNSFLHNPFFKFPGPNFGPHIFKKTNTPTQSQSQPVKPTKPPKPTTLTISHANVRSINNLLNYNLVESFVNDTQPHCMLLSETWLNESDTESKIKSRTPKGFKAFHQFSPPKPKAKPNAKTTESRLGGVGCFVDERFDSSTIYSEQYSTFTHQIVSVDFGKVKLNLVTIYRPPGIDTLPNFFDQFPSLLSRINTLQSSYVIVGDFNIWVDVADSQYTQSFNEILDNFGLKQHITGSTHELGHTLDLFITPEDCKHPPTSLSVTEKLSDHFSITAKFDLTIPPVPLKRITYRPIKKINMAQFQSDLAESDLIKNPCKMATTLYNQFHAVISGLLDRHAPQSVRTCPSRPPDPWISDEILTAKRKKRRSERAWRKTRSVVDRRFLSYHQRHYKQILSEAKSDWYTKIISENNRNPRKLWNSINQVLHRSQASPLPDCSDKSNLANKFGTYFLDKISDIRTILNSKICSACQILPDKKPPDFISFTPVTEQDVKKLISSAPNKSCDLDACPTSIVKDCIDILTPTITNIINYSLSEGVFPDRFKTAHVSPLLKKPSLPKNDFKNYRPVSNLNFISKLTEKVVFIQINNHVNGSGLDNPFQSAYKTYHSTETALLSVQNDIYVDMGKGKVTALTLLDLSAAFDTIDHAILLDRLKDWFGVSGDALKWIASYLSDRHQIINIQGNLSIPTSLLFGVPQGSVLGPLLFILYTAPLSKLLDSPDHLKHHLYADDTQVYGSFNTSTCDSVLKELQDTLVTVQEWMFANKLKLNPGKTEFMVVGNKCHRDKFDSKFPIDILGNQISPSPFARNLGVIFDADFNFQRQVNGVVKSCNYYIRDIRRIRKHLTEDSATALANALVSSRLDYCNSLLFSVPKCYIIKLQRVQNSLARVVTLSPRLTSSAPLRERLHWLPITSRITFKVALLTYKAIICEQPPSLHKLLTIRSDQVTTRSQTTQDRCVCKHLLHPSASGFGRRAFDHIAPGVWNAIPPPIRLAPSIANFRKALKTYYFLNPPHPPDFL